MSGIPTLILVPGLGCDAEVWSETIENLGDVATCRVADVSAGASIPEMAAAVLSDAPARFALAGHSLGGYVAFEILRRAPERVDHLALIGTSARPDVSEVSDRRRAMIALCESGLYERVIEGLIPSVVARARRDDAVLTERLTSMMNRVGAENFCRQQQAIIDRADSRPDLARIRVPTLIAAGDEDALMPASTQREMFEAISSADRVTIEGCGHSTPLERPHEIASALRSLLRRT
ncbi:MAG: alpha/beta fold hydrolase [Myxococcota bacterium]